MFELLTIINSLMIIAFAYFHKEEIKSFYKK